MGRLVLAANGNIASYLSFSQKQGAVKGLNGTCYGRN